MENKPEVEKKKCMTVRKSVKKDGTVVEKAYDQTKYNRTCYEKNKERYCEMTKCGCGREYNIYTKSNHNKSAFHELYEKMLPPITAVAPIAMSIESFSFFPPIVQNQPLEFSNNALLNADGVCIGYA